MAGKSKKRQAVAGGVTLILLIFAVFACPLSQAEPACPDQALQEPDIPKLDLTPPPPHRTLKGGVEHHEDAVAPPQKLSSSALNIFKKPNAEKLSGESAKGDPNGLFKQGVSDKNLNAQVQNGIGIIGVKFLLILGHMPVIHRVFPGTPAWDGGLHPLDIIVAIDGVPTLGLSKENVYSMIVGKPDTEVTISIRRGTIFIARTMRRMDFNDIPDPTVRMDYMMSI